MPEELPGVLSAVGYKENLVLLQYSPNVCHLQVVDKFPVEIELNLREKTWKYEGVIYTIGEQMRHCVWGSKGGPIGVYDRREINHLGKMVHHAQEATREPSPMAGPYAD